MLWLLSLRTLRQWATQMEKPCEWCGQMFSRAKPATLRIRRFCSKTCAMKAKWAAGVYSPEKISAGLVAYTKKRAATTVHIVKSCERCGKPFSCEKPSITKRHRFCSKACSMKDLWTKRPEWRDKARKILTKVRDRPE